MTTAPTACPVHANVPKPEMSPEGKTFEDQTRQELLKERKLPYIMSVPLSSANGDNVIEIDTNGSPLHYKLMSTTATSTSVPDMVESIQKVARKLCHPSSSNSSDVSRESFEIYRNTMAVCQDMLYRYAAYQKSQVWFKFPTHTAEETIKEIEKRRALMQKQREELWDAATTIADKHKKMDEQQKKDEPDATKKEATLDVPINQPPPTLVRT
jgi:hypothetical protein